MKKILIMLYLISFPFTSIGQDLEATQKQFNFYGCNNCYLSSSYSWFKQDSFLLGWHWGGGWKMSEALLTNQTHLVRPAYPDLIPPNSKLIIISNSISSNAQGTEIMNSPSIQFEPTLRISTPVEYHPRAVDNQIFGFKYINDNIVIYENDTRLKLLTSGNYVNSTVLKYPWLGGQMKYVSDVNDNTYNDIDSCNGKYWFFSINIFLY